MGYQSEGIDGAGVNIQILSRDEAVVTDDDEDVRLPIVTTKKLQATKLRLF